MRINKYTIKKPFSVTDLDFTILGFHKNTEYEKGRKKFTEYLDDNGILIVKKTFTDIIDDNGIFEGIHILFEWLGENGEVEATKEQKVYMDNFEASQYLQRRRERAIGYLIFSAQGTPIESHLQTIFTHYKNEIEEYKAIGSDTFKNAVEGETDPSIVPLLDIDIPLSDGTTIKVKDSILNAI